MESGNYNKKSRVQVALGCSITRYRSEVVIRKVETRFSSLGQVVMAAVLLNLTIFVWQSTTTPRQW